MAAGTAHRRRTAGRSAVGVLLAALVVLGPAGGARADRPDPSLPQARRQAVAAAARVDALAAEYRTRSAAVSRAVAGYAASFSAGVQAGLVRERSVAELDAALAARARTIRAIYAGGGVLTLGGSVLGAESVEDAIWRLDTSHRLFAGLLDRRGTELLRARREVGLADQRQRRLEVGRQQRGLDLAAVQEEQQRADLALAQARRILAGLDGRVARLQEAKDAAARLAAAQAAAEAAAAADRTALPDPRASDIPSSFVTAYREAARTCPGMRWTLLAAVGQVESGHGRNNGPSSAGAIGPMQFMPATFASYRVDGDHDGRTDPWDPQDAIFTAARYLCGSGGGAGADGVHRALLTYNHAEWYVDLVLGAQRSIDARFGG